MGTIVDELGWVVATVDPTGTTTADLDLRLARDKTVTPLCDSFGDRRPELYGAVTDAKIDDGTDIFARLDLLEHV